MLYIFYVLGLIVCIVLLKASKARRQKQMQGRTSKSKVRQKAEPLGTYKGECLSVEDAKTLAVTIHPKGGSEQRKFVRLFAVNVPRPNEPLGREAKQWLDQQCMGKKIKLVVWEIDSYKRLVGELQVGFLNKNLNLEMVKLGYADCDAWVFKDHGAYKKAQEAAKKKGVGKWS